MASQVAVPAATTRMRPGKSESGGAKPCSSRARAAAESSAPAWSAVPCGVATPSARPASLQKAVGDAVRVRVGFGFGFGVWGLGFGLGFGFGLELGLGLG